MIVPDRMFEEDPVPLTGKPPAVPMGHQEFNALPRAAQVQAWLHYLNPNRKELT